MVKNVLIVLLAALILFILWSIGLEIIYGYFLYYLIYLPVTLIPETSIDISTNSSHPIYIVTSFINNKEYTWSLSGELFLLPIVLLFSWQIFLFLLLPGKKAFRIARNNIIILVIAQSVYLLLLALYWKLSVARVVHDMLNNNLIIITVFLIIRKDRKVSKPKITSLKLFSFSHLNSKFIIEIIFHNGNNFHIETIFQYGNNFQFSAQT